MINSVNQCDSCCTCDGCDSRVCDVAQPSAWHAGGVSADRDWLTVPALAELLGVSASKVRRLLEDRILLAERVDGVLRIPADFLRDGEPLHELRGTIVVLVDAGFSDAEAMHWLLEVDDSLGAAPIDALRAGRKAEVRRVAQSLAF